MRYFILAFFLLFFGRLNAQFKHCDRLLQQGDTTICQYIKKGKITKEHFYLGQTRIFTRRWVYREDAGWMYCNGIGSYYWEQRISKNKKAKRNGPAEHYAADGTLQYTTFYRHGKRVGPTAGYYPNGVLNYTCERHLMNGKIDGRVNNYHPNGTIASKKIWKNGRLFEILAYKDDQGNELPVGTFDKGNGDVFRYIGQKPVLKDTYRNGKVIKITIIDNAGTETLMKQERL